MSLSSSDGQERRPNVVTTGRTATAKPGEGKAGAGKPGAGKPAGGGKGKKPAPSMKVNQGSGMGPLGMVIGVVVLALAIVGVGAFYIIKDMNATSDAKAKQEAEAKLEAEENKTPFAERAAKIEGIVNYVAQKPAWLTATHKQGVLTFQTTPPVGGDHNPTWQNCMGNVYDAPIANEHAVHSLEHGAVWITYNPSLPADQKKLLEDRVKGREFTMMSPYEGLDKPITLQAWGYQLKVDNANDPRIDPFIRALRLNATQEAGAVCSGGVNVTGTTPRNLGN
ncbi:hypothetical protein F4553_005447 [Allocatelliglobosispora scoriae]|uniref:DUF3105 domain-containing protein n=1 Tax=Allocatelliglobosispora scoriae TaxID=643052 RepID=A0A841BYL4_9ACTN|nr:DUF3105 domain-containing protein [Allocatelliglobosispora scoriae]MBB5872013.1 hypothetical protein [Allocatelliglobosispora scoriae]